MPDWKKQDENRWTKSPVFVVHGEFEVNLTLGAGKLMEPCQTVNTCYAISNAHF